MWILFNKDHGDNKRDDLVDMDNREATILVEEKIAQKIENPHEVLANLRQKKAIEATK